MSDESTVSASAPIEAAPVESQIESSLEPSQEELAAEQHEAAPVTENKSKEEPKKGNKKTLKLKVDGQELEETLDLDDEDSLRKHLQLSKAAQKRMQEYADLRKQVEEFVEFARKDPRALLKEVGYDPEKFAEELMNERIENSRKSPEQLEKERLVKELEQLKKERETEKSAREKAEYERLKNEEAQKLDDMMSQALTSGGLPKSAATVKRMADYMLIAAQNNVDLEPSDLIPLLKKELQDDLKDLFSASPDELVEELVSKERIANIRRSQLAKAKQQAQTQTANQVKSAGVAKSSEKAAPKKMTVRDWLRSS